MLARAIAIVALIAIDASAQGPPAVLHRPEKLPTSATGLRVEKMRFENTISTFDWAVRNVSMDRTYLDLELAVEYLDEKGARLSVRTFRQKGQSISPGKDALFTEKDPGAFTGQVRDAKLLRLRASYKDTSDKVGWEGASTPDRRKGPRLSIGAVDLFSCDLDLEHRVTLPKEGIASSQVKMIGFETHVLNDGFLGQDDRDRGVEVRTSFADDTKKEWGGGVGILVLRWSDESVVWKGTAGAGTTGSVPVGSHVLHLTMDGVEVARIPFKVLSP